MIHYVVYTHTDFLDICKIQTEYLSGVSKSLLINKNNLEIEDIYSKYENIIFYDDSLPYASRLCELDKLKDMFKYILLTHDIDIVLKKDDTTLDKVISLMDEHDMTRVDLQIDWENNWIDNRININTGEVNGEMKDNDIFLTLNRKGYYQYNVNASIWNLNDFLSVIIQFKELTYRSIESSSELQAKLRDEYRVYKLYTNENNRRGCGYFVLLDFYQYLHITHGGHLIPLDKTGQHNSLSDFAHEEYKKIVDNFLTGTNRHFRRGMSEHEV